MGKDNKPETAERVPTFGVARVRRYTKDEIRAAIHREIKNEYLYCLDTEEMDDKIYEITGIVIKALENYDKTSGLT